MFIDVAGLNEDDCFSFFRIFAGVKNAIIKYSNVKFCCKQNSDAVCKQRCY